MDKASEKTHIEKTEKETIPSFMDQLGPILFLTSILFFNFLGRIVFSPLMPTIENDLGLTHANAGMLFLMISLGFFLSLIGSGFISCRIGHKKTIVTSAIAVGFMLWVLSTCENLWGMRVGMFLLGLGAGLYLPSGIASVTSIVQPRHWGKALAVHELAPNLSFVLAPLLAEGLMRWFSWRGVLLSLGICCLLTGMAFARFGKGAEGYGMAPSFSSFKALFRERSFWIMILLFSLGITGTLGIYTMLPLYLVAEHGIERNWANTVVALSRISGLFMAFLAGWASDRVGPKKAMGVVFLITGILTILLGSLPSSWLVLIIFLQPAVAVCFFPPGFAALSSIGPPNARNVAVSLTVPAAFVIGGGAIPVGIGMMGDAGSLGLGISLAGGLVGMGFLLAFFLKTSRS